MVLSVVFASTVLCQRNLCCTLGWNKCRKTTITVMECVEKLEENGAIIAASTPRRGKIKSVTQLRCGCAATPSSLSLFSTLNTKDTSRHVLYVCGLFLVAWLCPNCRRNNTDPAVWRNPLAPALPSEGGGEPKASGWSHWSSSVRSRCRPAAHWATGLRIVSEGSYLFVCCECVWCGVVWWAYCWLLTGQIGGPVAATGHSYTHSPITLLGKWRKAARKSRFYLFIFHIRNYLSTSF
jgi:hypothetical protein